jgi:hypothetical protein
MPVAAQGRAGLVAIVTPTRTREPMIDISDGGVVLFF